MMPVQLFQILIEGSEEFLNGFMKGLTEGTGKIGFWLILDAKTFHLQSMGERIIERLKYSKHTFHLILDEALYSTFQDHFSSHAVKSELKVIQASKVQNALFKFEFACYNPERANDINAMLSASNALDIQIKLENIKQTRDLSASGIELYTPAHEFEYTGKGTAEGSLKSILEFHNKMSECALFEINKINLHLGEEISISSLC